MGSRLPRRGGSIATHRRRTAETRSALPLEPSCPRGPQPMAHAMGNAGAPESFCDDNRAALPARSPAGDDVSVTRGRCAMRARSRSTRRRLPSEAVAMASASTRFSIATRRCARTIAPLFERLRRCRAASWWRARGSATRSSGGSVSPSRSTARNTRRRAHLAMDLIPRIIPAADGRRSPPDSPSACARSSIPRRPLRRRDGGAPRPHRAALAGALLERVRPRGPGIAVPHAARCVVAGSDLVRDDDGTIACSRTIFAHERRFVRAREPRHHDARSAARVRAAPRPAIDHYCASLHAVLRSIAPTAAGDRRSSC